MVPIIVFAAERLIPHCATKDLKAALTARGVEYERGAEDVNRIIEYEHVLDMFHTSDQGQLVEEIKSARLADKTAKEYLRDAKQYRAFLAFT